jgi:hypothetical protein
MGGKRVVVGPVAFEIEGDDVFAADDDDLLDVLGEREGLGAAAAFLVGAGGLVDRDLVLLKEPLSLDARRSALAMIEPIDGHGCVLHKCVSVHIHSGSRSLPQPWNRPGALPKLTVKSEKSNLLTLHWSRSTLVNWKSGDAFHFIARRRTT